MGHPAHIQKLSYQKAQHEYDNQVPGNTYEPGLDEENHEQLFGRMNKQSQEIFLVNSADINGYQRAFQLIATEIPEERLDDLRYEMIEEIKFPQKKIDNITAYIKLKDQLQFAYTSYKFYWKRYIELKDSDYESADKRVAYYMEGSAYAYKLLIKYLIKQLKK